MRKLFKIFLPVVLLCAALTGCTVEEESRQGENSKYRFYYLNKSETGLESEAYEPAEETADFMLPDLMSRLNEKENSLSGISLLPEEVEISSYEISDKVLNVEFNSRYRKMSAAREVLTRAGVVKTLLQVPGIEAVKFYIGQEELKDSKDQPVGEMSDSTFAEFSAKNLDTYRSDTFTLYFTDKEGKHLVEEKRRVFYRRNIPKVRVALEQLAKGPMEENHFQTIPENTKLLNVTVADGACYVDFNPVFLDYALTNVEESIPVYSVVNTALAACDAEKVEISVAGEREVVFRENMNLYNFYKWNEDIISGKDKEE